MSHPSLRLFQGYGVEIEYMLVDSSTLSVMPASDRVIEAVAGEIVSEVEVGEISWSNEFVLHVIELKTNGPASALKGLSGLFQRDVEKINGILSPLGGRLMPTAAHPWMDPHTETRLWPHEYSRVYQTYNRIFDCRGHGWANLQSIHLNLPFSGDDEFGRLHAAIRFLMPIMPAVAASSPILDSRATGLLDSRMEAYLHNSDRVPSVTGPLIPERIFTEADYRRDILERMYADIAPLDPDGVLRDEWLNARGAIARFDRDAIEIRVLDTQECPHADLAVIALISSALKRLAGGEWVTGEEQRRWEAEPLAEIFRGVMKDAQSAVIRNREYLSAFGLKEKECTAGELWRHIAGISLPGFEYDPEWARPLKQILEKGSLSRRILKAIGGDTRKEKLKEVYSRLCDCLAEGSIFDA